MAVNLMEYKWKKIIIIGIIVFLLSIFVIIGIISSKYIYEMTYYNIESHKIEQKIRVVQISDLHNSQFGIDNEKLIEAIKNQKPDLILLTGDLLNSGDTNLNIACDLISNLASVAPVYCSYGNHEQEYENKYQKDIAYEYEIAGATVLEKEYIDITLKDQHVRIGGIGGYCLPAKYGSEADQEECEFLLEFQNTDAYTILMCHMPVCWLRNDGINEWNVDCVFSGHVHGGEVIIPFIGGLYAPDMGFFPGKLQGLYYSQDYTKVLVLSRGLGTTEIIPRFNNTPEIVVTDIKTKQ